jgi:hypothetical protein
MSVHPIRQAAAAVADITDTFDFDCAAVQSIVKREMDSACESFGVRLVDVFWYLLELEKGGQR